MNFFPYRIAKKSGRFIFPSPNLHCSLLYGVMLFERSHNVPHNVIWIEKQFVHNWILQFLAIFVKQENGIDLKVIYIVC